MRVAGVLIVSVLAAALVAFAAGAQQTQLQQVILLPDCDITRDEEGTIIDYTCPEEPQPPVDPDPEPEPPVIPDEPVSDAPTPPKDETLWDILAPNTGFERASGVAALAVIIPLLLLLLPKRKKRQE